jgi:hypothetical protein
MQCTSLVPGQNNLLQGDMPHAMLDNSSSGHAQKQYVNVLLKEMHLVTTCIKMLHGSTLLLLLLRHSKHQPPLPGPAAAGAAAG